MICKKNPTPLNYANDSNGDCGNIAICNAGPNKGKVCDPTKEDIENGCEQILPAGVCQSTKKICYGKNKNDKEVSELDKTISCDNTADCTKAISDGTGLICDWEPTLHCVGGIKNGSDCTNDLDKCVGGPYYYTNSCPKENNVRGLCVGGLNHNLFCGSSLDCPPKKYNDSSGETVEYGICVGAVTDMNKTIPKSPALGTPKVPAGQWRLYELFVQSFHTWLWNEAGAKYGKDGKAEANDDLIDHSGPSAWDALGTNVAGWKVNSEPPVVSDITVNDQNGSVPLSSGASTAILRFHAYADNDQMPIVRMAVDWGDGTVAKPNVYQVKGWFKNRKKQCNQMTFESGNGCNSGTDCRIRFGDSSDACEEGFYQFTHIYECPGKVTADVPACSSQGVTANCWDSSTQSCKFTPKVQVLDNWGWCNSSDGKGKWNDNETDPKNDDKRNCYTGSNTNNPWTSFGGMIEVKP